MIAGLGGHPKLVALIEKLDAQLDKEPISIEAEPYDTRHATAL
jgi:hypothetical protein